MELTAALLFLLFLSVECYEKRPSSALEAESKLKLQLTGSYAALVDGCIAQLALNLYTNSGSITKETSKFDAYSQSVTYDTIPSLNIYEPSWGGTFISFDLNDSIEPFHKRKFFGVLVSVGVGGTQWAIYGHYTDEKRPYKIFRWVAIRNAANTYPGEQVVSNPDAGLYAYTNFANGWAGFLEIDNLNWMNNNPIPGNKDQSFELHLLDRVWKYKYNGLYVKFTRPQYKQYYYGLYTTRGFHGEFVIRNSDSQSDYNNGDWPWHAQEANSSSYCPDGVSGLKSATYAVLGNGYAGQLSLKWNQGQVSGTIAYEGSQLPTGTSQLGKTETITVTQIAKDWGCYLYFLRPDANQQYYAVFDKFFKELHGNFVQAGDGTSYSFDGRLYASVLG